MRAVIAHSPSANVRTLRQILLGAGLECFGEDCVVWERLPVRLAQVEADLVLLQTDDAASMNWQLLQEARSLSRAPLVVVGPAAEPEGRERARQAGADLYLEAEHLRVGLDEALDRMVAGQRLPTRRGTVISVLAPTPGSGGSFVAANLAGALAEKYPQDVALVESARAGGDIALLLNVEPQHTIADVCQRWETLDATSLRSGLSSHPSGLRLLVNTIEHHDAEFWHPDSVRRIAVLARVAFAVSVLALDSRMLEEDLEAMRLSDCILMVVRPDVPAVRRAKIALDLATGQGVPRERFRLVANRWGQSGQLKAKQIESSLNLPVEFYIPDDPGRANRAANMGVLLREVSRHASVSRRFARLAAAVNGKVQTK